jgi:hypothetical protein
MSLERIVFRKAKICTGKVGAWLPGQKLVEPKRKEGSAF